MTDINSINTAPVIQQTVAAQSEKTNQNVVEADSGYLGAIQDAFNRGLETVSSTSSALYSATKTSIGNSIEVLQSGTARVTSQTQEALRYEGLSSIGRSVAEGAANFVQTNTASTVASAKDWASWGTEQISGGASVATTVSIDAYLPVAVLGLSAFTAYSALSNGVNNAKAAHAAYKNEKPEVQAQAKGLAGRAFVQILSGAAAAALSGAIAYGSPVGVFAHNKVSNLFGSN